MATDADLLLDAANAFLKLLKNADDATLLAAYQVMATEANDSDYGTSHEPLAVLAEVFQRETLQRLLDSQLKDAGISHVY